MPHNLVPSGNEELAQRLRSTFLRATSCDERRYQFGNGGPCFGIDGGTARRRSRRRRTLPAAAIADFLACRAVEQSHSVARRGEDPAACLVRGQIAGMIRPSARRRVADQPAFALSRCSRGIVGFAFDSRMQ